MTLICWSPMSTGRGWMGFFFSSRRRHTRLQGDWSSDVCSSDLPGTEARAPVEPRPPVQDLQVARLEGVLRGGPVARAARDRPAEGCWVQASELQLQSLGRHRAFGGVKDWCLGGGWYMTTAVPQESRDHPTAARARNRTSPATSGSLRLGPARLSDVSNLVSV